MEKELAKWTTDYWQGFPLEKKEKLDMIIKDYKFLTQKLEEEITSP